MKQKLLELLESLRKNCGDSRGMDGEYLDKQVGLIRDLVKQIPEVKE